ncbi:MAG: F0F1 ATP synthase subunit beta [Candidatus Omnitrophica bacterium]|nr:F0F1 ATP synthase subunit beta [Candidatus Omnitrophota bacterium]
MANETSRNNKMGRVVAVQGPVVDIKFKSIEEIPSVYGVLKTETVDQREIFLEVAEHRAGNIARCIAINSTQNLQRNAKAVPMGPSIEVPVGDVMYSRVINIMGQPIDQKGVISAKKKAPIRVRELGTKIRSKAVTTKKFEVLETGVKIIDLLFPLVKGSKTGVLGGAGLGKSIITLEIIHNIVTKHQGTCVFVGIGERIREGNELLFELSKHGILPKTMIVFGQMNEPPGARYGVAMTGATLAETLQKENQDVLLFVDNIFRFIQAGAEISTLLGRVPSETGYQPTLISEASEFHERIRSGGGVAGSVTSIEAVYVPADDLTDPAVVAIFTFLDSLMVLSRERVQLGLYPAIDPLQSSCANLDPDVVGKRHYQISQDVLQAFYKYEELRKLVLVIGIDELSPADRLIYDRARKIQNFLTQPFSTAEAYTGKKGYYVPIEETIKGCEEILSGRHDKRSEEEFYMVGPLT